MTSRNEMMVAKRRMERELDDAIAFGGVKVERVEAGRFVCPTIVFKDERFTEYRWKLGADGKWRCSSIGTGANARTPVGLGCDASGWVATREQSDELDSLLLAAGGNV